jgi:hypothetical protein
MYLTLNVYYRRPEVNLKIPRNIGRCHLEVEIFKKGREKWEYEKGRKMKDTELIEG